MNTRIEQGINNSIWGRAKRALGAEAYQWTWDQKKAQTLKPINNLLLGTLLGVYETVFPAIGRTQRYRATASFVDRFRYDMALPSAIFIDLGGYIFCLSMILSDFSPPIVLASKFAINIAEDLAYRKLVMTE